MNMIVCPPRREHQETRGWSESNGRGNLGGDFDGDKG